MPHNPHNSSSHWSSLGFPSHRLADVMLHCNLIWILSNGSLVYHHCVQVAKKAKDLQQYLSSLPRDQCFYAMIQLMRRFTSQCEVQAGSGSTLFAGHGPCTGCDFRPHCKVAKLNSWSIVYSRAESWVCLATLPKCQDVLAILICKANALSNGIDRTCLASMLGSIMWLYQ